MFLGLKPPYDSVGPLEAFLGVDVTFFRLITLSSNYQHDNVVLGLLCIDGRDPHVGINCKRQIQAAEKQGPLSESQYHIIIYLTL